MLANNGYDSVKLPKIESPSVEPRTLTLVMRVGKVRSSDQLFDAKPRRGIRIAKRLIALGRKHEGWDSSTAENLRVVCRGSQKRAKKTELSFHIQPVYFGTQA